MGCFRLQAEDMDVANGVKDITSMVMFEESSLRNESYPLF